MQSHGIEIIISADVHFDEVEGIRRIDPARVGSRGRSPSRTG
jgi:hypothetical protein